MTDRTATILLLRNGLMPAPIAAIEDADPADRTALGTVLANMAHYGYAPSRDALDSLTKLGSTALEDFWGQLEPLLAEVSGDNRDMAAHVVYKNFPREVLEMNEADYWLRQILMYVGFPNALFTEEKEDRAPLDEALDLRILDIAGENAWHDLFDRMVASGASWQRAQIDAIEPMLACVAPAAIDLNTFGFRANGVRMAVAAMVSGCDIAIQTTSATDVLRLAAGLSALREGTDLAEIDVELRGRTRFGRFSRPERRRIVTMLGNCADLETDFGRRRETWKRLLSFLHPGDFRNERVNRAYAGLVAGSPSRLTARLEAAFRAKDASALDLLTSEPGTFLRHLHRAYAAFGKEAFARFAEVFPALTVEQLLKIRAYLATVEDRTLMLVRPKGYWAKAQTVAFNKAPIAAQDRDALLSLIDATVGARINAALPVGIDLDASAHEVRLASNGQELAAFGRGTTFDIPANATFVRSASFWAHETGGFGNTWFDNGWNFFKADWTSFGACCWDHDKLKDGDGKTLAVFSGDPTNSKDLEGRGCQMIDLYLDRLEAAGVRYAVWSVLCYSHVSFAEASDVLATLQWGENPQKGKLYEPARAQMVFPLKGQEATKYVSYLDLTQRKLVYMDAGLPGRVSTAAANDGLLARMMPAFLEHVRGLPTVGDLFAPARAGTIPVTRSDADREIDGPAWVLDRRRAENRIEPVALEPLLALKGY